jgi:chromosome segregation ATPase
MKEVETLKQENESLRKESATLKMQLKQLSAAQVALDQSYSNVIRELQQMKTQVVLDGQEKQDFAVKIKSLENEIANVKVENESLKKEVKKVSKAASKEEKSSSAVLDCNIEEEAA